MLIHSSMLANFKKIDLIISYLTEITGRMLKIYNSTNTIHKQTKSKTIVLVRVSED